MLRFSLIDRKFYTYTFSLLLGLTCTFPSYAQSSDLPLTPLPQATDLTEPTNPSAIADSPTNNNLPESIPNNSVDTNPVSSPENNPESPVSPETVTDSTATENSNSSDINDDPNDPNARLRLPPNAAEGLPIQQVFLYIRNPPSDPSQDQTLRQQLTDTFSIRAGGNFAPLLTDQGLNQVQRLPFVKKAEYRLYQSALPGTVILALLVTLQSPDAEKIVPAKPPSGLFVSGKIQDFPVLYQNDGALAKVIMNGGLGVFSDIDPWFGNANNFVAGAYKPNGTITWEESYLELGLAGISRLGESSTYLYGAASYMFSDTIQPDIFRVDGRFYRDIEKLYGGLLIAPVGSPFSLNVSAGRQIFQLNQGFLFSQFAGSANALERGASYLNPRTTYDMTVLADLRWGDFRLQGFFLEPDELPIADTNTQFLGTSLSYNNNQGLEAVLSYITIPHSSRFYVLPNGDKFSREGLQVINPRLRYSSLFNVPGLWFEGEYAFEFSDRYTMSAQAAYAWLGYTANDWPWRPTISYRFAGFSGDNPNTSAYERFDPLLASGLTDWLQGISLGKVFNNSNNFSHRVTITVLPSSNLEFSLNYYYRFADTLNNLGGNPVLQSLQSTEIGQEILLLGRYYISQNFMLQGVGSIAFPGSAIRQAVSNSASPWTTLQLSLFMFF